MTYIILILFGNLCSATRQNWSMETSELISTALGFTNVPIVISRNVLDNLEVQEKNLMHHWNPKKIAKKHPHDKLVHHSCDCTLTIDEDASQFLIRHKGTHNHEAPPAVGKMSFMSQKEFEKFVLLSPETKPRQLRLGAGFRKTAYEISPNLINTDKIKYERKTILKHHGISNTLEMII